MRYQELAKLETPTFQHQKGTWNASDEYSSTSDTSCPSTVGDQIVPRLQDKLWVAFTQELHPSVQSQALGFFFSNFVITPSFIPRGQLDFLPELMSQPDTKAILQASVMATALATLANATKCEQVMKQAQEHYVAALSMTNKAIQSPTTVTEDSTLISVVMLGMYEHLRMENTRSLKSWAKHMNGACELIALRGKDQLHSSVGQKLFGQLYGTILLVATETRLPVPKSVADLWELNTRLGDYHISGRQWVTEMVHFMRRTIDLRQDSTSNLAAKVAIAYQIDKELEDTMSSITNIWMYKTVYLETPIKDVYGSFYHIYLDPWAAQLWSNLHCIKLLLYSVVRTELMKGMKYSPPLFKKEAGSSQLKASENIIRTATAGICACVPQLTGQIAFPDLSSRKPDMSTPFTNLIDPQDPIFRLQPRGTFLNSSKSTGMHFLVWLLYHAGMAESNPNSFREWAIEVLHFLALRIGTREAVILAEELKQANRTGISHEMLSYLDISRGRI